MHKYEMRSTPVSVVHYGIEQVAQKRPLWFQTPLKMAIPGNSALSMGMGAISDYASKT